MCDNRGMALLPILLILLVLILGGVILAPAWKYCRDTSERNACELELATARDMLTIDYLTENAELTPAEAKETVTYAMNGWEDLCPAGGDTYVIDNPEGEPPYTVVCGLHDTDEKRRTRLNAWGAKRQIEEQLKDAAESGSTIPEQIRITLNSRIFTAVLVTEDPGVHRGTKQTMGYEDEKYRICYSTAGTGSGFRTKNLSEGEMCYFCYADEEYCAVWNAEAGWSGDSFES